MVDVCAENDEMVFDRDIDSGGILAAFTGYELILQFVVCADRFLIPVRGFLSSI